MAKRANTVIDSLEMYAGKSTFPWNVYARSRYRNVKRKRERERERGKEERKC